MGGHSSYAQTSRSLNRLQLEDHQMSESYEKAKALIAECSTDELIALRHLAARIPHPLESEWGIDADTVLNAIQRSSDLTKRGVRGIIAEAVFETSVIPAIKSAGWNQEPIDSDLSYDVRLKNGQRNIRIQIKLQRLEKGTPKYYYPKQFGAEAFYVVEVQKTRTGTKTTKQPLPGSE